MVGKITSSSGKAWEIGMIIKVTEKYLKQLPKEWRTNGLIVDGSFVSPDLTKDQWAFLAALDSGKTFTVTARQPKTVQIKEKDATKQAKGKQH
jgi:hypothetical protein